MNDRTDHQTIDRRLRREVPLALKDVETSPDLHGRIMHRVRQVDDVAGPTFQFNRGWLAAAAAAVVAMVAIGVVRTPTSEPAEPVAEDAPVVPTLPYHLARLESPSGLPEQALKEEYERLKSDLRKLGIRS